MPRLFHNYGTTGSFPPESLKVDTDSEDESVIEIDLANAQRKMRADRRFYRRQRANCIKQTLRLSNGTQCGE